MRTATTALAVPLLLATTGHAQQARLLEPHRQFLEPTAGEAVHPPQAMVRRAPGGAKSAVVELGRMQNAYSMQRPSCNQVHHVPALNTVLVVRRENPADHGGTPGRSSLRFDRSTNGGVTWQTGTLLTPTMFNGGQPGNGLRHPNGFLYNPPGNSDPANAHVVAQAPAVSGSNFFRMLCDAAAELDGGAAQDLYTNHWPGQSTGWVHSLQWAANGHAWSIVTNVDTADQSLSRGEFKVLKGTWNTAQQRMDWETAALLTDAFHSYESNGQWYLLNVDWGLAFAPDGQTGYAIVTGKLAVGPPASTYPIVWKTTDAGATWTQQPVHDFSLEQVFIDHLEPAQGSGLVRPYFGSVSSTVDAAGRLHLFAHVYSGYHSSPDSANWIYADPATQVLAHAISPDGASWTVNHVAPVINTEGDLWGGTSIKQDVRPQLARTTGGTKLFLLWSATVEEESNILPDILARAYDAVTGQYSAEKNLTLGTGAELGAYWFQVAPTAIEGGAERDYELPIAYTEPGTTDLQPATAWYLRGVGFDEEEINVGIAGHDAPGRVVIFPNPSTGRFTIHADGLLPGELTVSDPAGRVVHRQRTVAATQAIALDGLAAGVYLVRVSDGRRVATAPLVVEAMR